MAALSQHPEHPECCGTISEGKVRLHHGLRHITQFARMLRICQRTKATLLLQQPGCLAQFDRVTIQSSQRLTPAAACRSSIDAHIVRDLPALEPARTCGSAGTFWAIKLITSQPDEWQFTARVYKSPSSPTKHTLHTIGDAADYLDTV